MLLKSPMQPLTEGVGQLMWLPVLIQGDGLSDVIDHYLARVAAGHVLFELLADGRINRAVHVVVKQSQKLFTFHMPVDFKAVFAPYPNLSLLPSRELLKSYRV
jgi:hypothetical protein